MKEEEAEEEEEKAIAFHSGIWLKKIPKNEVEFTGS